METLNNYLSFIYPGTLILFIVLFIIWYAMRLKQKRSIGMNIFLFLGLVIYLISFYKNYGLQLFIIFWLIRDILIFFIIFFLIKFTIRNTTLVIVVIVGACAILGYWYYKNGTLPFTKPKIEAFEYTPTAELLIDIKDKNKLGEVSKLLEPYQSRIQLAFSQIKDTADTDLDDYYTVDIINFNDTVKILQKLEKSGLLEDVEFNEMYSLSPIETLSPDSVSIKNYTGKSLNDPKIGDLWAFNYMEIDNLIGYLKNAKPIKKAKIYILDTGVDATHEDLADNYASLSEKYDVDTDKHGSHCAGIACAVSNNQLGIASLNLTGQFTTVTSITVLPGGSGRQEEIIDGIILAADNDADVISMSLGGASSDLRQKAYEKAIKYANDKGAIVVVAAGNENINAKNSLPASCKGVIAVSAVDDQLQKASFSNYVTDIQYKLSAPGVNILSTTPGNNYQFLNGTSMATPYVSGLIGILKAFQPSLTTEEVYNILNTTGKETKNTSMTGKFIQPLAALKSIDIKSTQSVIIAFFDKVSDFKPRKD
jgi:thermitase